MKRLIMAVAACGICAAWADDVGVTRDSYGNYVIAAGGTITIGPNGASTNNTQNALFTFTDGGTIKAIPTDANGTTQSYHRLWGDYMINGAVTYDGSDLPAAVTPEFRRGFVATNGTLTISSDRSVISLGSADPARTSCFPLYDMPNVVFESGSGTIVLSGEATLRDVPGGDSDDITFNPNGARLAIAGQAIVSNRVVWSTKRVSFNDYGSTIFLLDESYIPDGVTPVFTSSKTFSIRPSDIVVTSNLLATGSIATHMCWQAKEGSGTVPFDIDLNGGTLELVSTRSTYAFKGKIYRGGTIDLQGAYTRTLAEVEGTFTFKNSTSTEGTVVFQKVNPGSRLSNGGTVAFVFEDGALPANASMTTVGGVQYVFVPAEDGSLDMTGLSSEFRCTSSFVPVGADVTLTGEELATMPKVGVTNGANVTVALDGTSVPSVVGGDGTLTVSTAIPEGLPALWIDASMPYDVSAGGSPYYAAPASKRSGYDFGNIFFTNGYPLVETVYDVRGTNMPARLYLSRYYDNNEYKLFTHVYPFLAQGEFGGRTMNYLSCGEYQAKDSTWSNDGADTPTVISSYGGLRRINIYPWRSDLTAVVMVFGSQQGGGIAMLGGGEFTRSGRTLDDAICAASPSSTTIWVDGEEVDPTTAKFNGGWQVISVSGSAMSTVNIIGQDKVYSDCGGQNYAELLFFTNAITDVQRQQVESYLARKWGVSTYSAGSGSTLPLRAEGRSGTVAVAPGADVELRGTFAGNLTVDGSVTISEALPWTADDVPSDGLVDWYDADDTNSLVLTRSGSYANVVSRQYPRGTTRETLTSGYYLWGTGNRMPFAVSGARGLGAERTWLDYNHPADFTGTTSDGNVLRFMPYDKAATGSAVSRTFRTLLVALDSSNGGGSVVASGSVGGASGDFRYRTSTSYTESIWPSSCSSNVKGGVTRLNGAVVDYTDGLTGGPEVLSLTAAGNVSAICVDTYKNTESSSSNGSYVLNSHGTIQGEMLMYDGELDADVLANLEAYLMGKWTGVLPDGWSDLREATVTSGTGTVTSVVAKMPSFGDGFTGTVEVEDTALSFTYDGTSQTVGNAIVARGATVSMPSAVTVSVTCANMQGASAVSVPLIDAAAFSGSVAWTLESTGEGGKKLLLRQDGGQLLLEVLQGGMTVIVR